MACHLDWDGCFNVRDLGGLPVAGGGATRWGAAVRADALAADYALSTERLRARYAACGEPDQGPALDAYLADHGTTATAAIEATLAELDVVAQLRAGGLGDEHVAAIRRRLVVPER